MIQEKNDKYSVLKPDLNTAFKEFYTQLVKEINNFKKNNLILDLSELQINLNELILFKKIAENKAENGTSFVVINTSIGIDEVPDEIIVVPTFQEAIDIIEMDEMTRSLDF